MDQKYERQLDEDDLTPNTADTPTPTQDSPQLNGTPKVAFTFRANWWQKRTLLEQILIVLLIVTLLVLIVISALLGAKRNIPASTGEQYCITPPCITVASSVINAMDTSVNPCDDFFTYACGGWIKTHPIPSGHSRWGTFGVLWQENQLVMKNSIEVSRESLQNEAERKAQDYYNSCVDKNKTVEKLGAQPMLQLLAEIHMVDINSLKTNSTILNLDFNQTILRTHQYDIDVLFTSMVSADERNSSVNILQVDQSGLGLPDRDYYLNKSITEDKVLSAYLKYMTDVGELLGWDRNKTREASIKIIEFETILANLTVPADKRRDEEKNYHKMTIADMQNRFKMMKWLYYFNGMLNNTEEVLTSKEPIVVYAPEYMTPLTDLLAEMLATDEGKITLYNYISWHIIKTMVPCLSEKFRKAQTGLTTALSGTQGKDEVWRYCISDTDNTVGFALGAMFVRNAFEGGSKEKAETMVNEVRDAFKKNLPFLDWMDDDTRKKAIEKANAVIDMIGFPPWILNDTALEAFYEGFEVDADAYFQNNVNALLFVIKKNMAKLRKKPDKLSWGMTPPTVNAYYSPSKNEIVFPAGILQAPFYDKDYPKSLNFGGMGVVMGHELTHGFDDQGREFDKFGNLHPWWNNVSVAKFKKQASCMEKQYSTYDVYGEKVNGKQTLGENIADNGGLKSAYHAYETWLTQNGEEKPLPGTNLTHRQLFFIGFSQVWCSSNTQEQAKMQLKTDSHSPAKYRVIGTLSNSKEFAEQYKCPVGSLMNPSNKCVVW